MQPAYHQEDMLFGWRGRIRLRFHMDLIPEDPGDYWTPRTDAELRVTVVEAFWFDGGEWEKMDGHRWEWVEALLPGRDELEAELFETMRIAEGL